MYFKFSIAGFFLTLIIVFATCKKDKKAQNSDEKQYSNVLDNIEVVPEWLNVVVDDALPDSGLNVWIPTGNFQLSSLIRVPRFPRVFTENEIKSNPSLKKFAVNQLETKDNLNLVGIRNEQVSAQLAMAAREDLTNVYSQVSELKSKQGDIIEANNIQVRYVRYVPVQRSRSEYIWSARYEDVAGEEVSGFMSPDVVGDPLVEMEYVDVPAYRAQPVWFTFNIPKNAMPGKYSGTITIFLNEYEQQSFNIDLEVLENSIPDPVDYEFFLDMWLNPNSIAYNHHVQPWSEEHWSLIGKYMADLASRGGKTITASITSEPWRKPWLNGSLSPQTKSGFESLVQWKLTKDGIWNFDYSVFDRYVQLAMNMGLKERINIYSLTSFSGQERIEYFDETTNSIKEQFFDSVGDLEYKSIWAAFLQSFVAHLNEKSWLDKTYLCFDERPYEVMQQITRFVNEQAPEFNERLSIAGHPESTDFAQNFLSIAYEFFPDQNLYKEATLSVIKERNEEKKLTTFYLCGQPAHPNTLTFSPAMESQLIPWIALKYDIAGYLRWAYCSWPEDPFTNPVHNYIQGDEYIVYPGKNGPVSSIRWELMKEGIEDYELSRIIIEEGSINEENLSKVIDLTTRMPDGRFKEVADFNLAKKILLNLGE
ncbi:glycoside hydrolase domain-containing protein [Reichenbachiella sp. MALMAid0571]|uniref:DUF4091 domain-containing protein n=1 Tax=Reichenbachiella sp. MALMAid0571 TaxID=3143939 RepID=UPI0032E0230A